MQHEELIISAASKTSVTGAATTVVGAVSNMDLLTVVGVLVAIGGFLINLIFQFRRDRRELKEHEARMNAIPKNIGD